MWTKEEFKIKMKARRDDLGPCYSNPAELNFFSKHWIPAMHLKALAPMTDQLLCSSQLPWCQPRRRWWRVTWVAIHAGQGHWPCHSCWSVPSHWCAGPMSAAIQISTCSRSLGSCGTALLQQQCLNVTLLSGSKMQSRCHRDCSWMRFESSLPEQMLL